MLGLKMATDPRWVNIVERNLHEILIDHAFCEQKAASNAISMIVQYPFYVDLVQAMTEICQEEMMHFDMVHQKLLDRGLTLTFERKDPYVNDLALYLKRSAHGSKEGYFVGNGGLSLRNKDKMIEICTLNDDKSNIPLEDIFFVKNLKGEGVADIETAYNFSMEDIFSEHAMGLHNPIKIDPNLLEKVLLF